MLVGIASIIMSIGTSTTLFIQTLSLSRCKNIECCSVSSCTQEGMRFGKQAEEQEEQDSEGDNNDMQVVSVD